MKTASIITIFLILITAFSGEAKDRAWRHTTNSKINGVQASANYNAGTNALEISMQSNGKPESILVYVSRSNGTVVHYEYVTITSETTILKIDLSDEGSGVFNLRLHGNSLQHSYAFKRGTS